MNAVTIKDAYPIPRIDESLSKLGDAKFFTTLDLGSAFWQVPLRKKDREKTGFACELGLYQWKRMPFGLCNATATFQRLMAQALTGVTKKYGNLLMCYVDDVVIATPSLEDHIDRLDEVFGCMKRAGLKCKPSKCEILRDSIKYLGRMVDRHGVRPDPEAVEAVLTWKAPRTDTQLMSFLGFANYYREFIKGYADKVYPMQKLMRNKGKKFEWNEEAQVAFENIKRELCEAPVLGMPTEKGMYVLDTDASVVAISGILHQEQEWNGRTVLRPIAYGSKVLSDTEMKYGAPKAEMFAVVTFVEKYRAYLGSAPFKLRVDNRALSWLKTYSMDQSYIGRWIVRLDGYHMIIEHRMRDKHQNADSLSKKTEFYERLEQKQANQAEIKEGFSFLDKETYEALPLTRWLDRSGHPIPGHPELPVEKAAEIKILSKGDPIPLDLLLRSNLVQQELSRMNINSLSLLDKTVQVTPQVMRMLGGLLEREVTRDDPEWTAAVASLTVREKVKIMPSRRQHEENERDCRTIVQQLVSSIPQEILTSTSYGQKEQESGKQKKTVTFVDRDEKGEVVKQNLLQDYLSGEKDKEKDQRSQDQHPAQENLSGESEIDEKIPDEKQDLENKVLSGEFRWMRRRYGPDLKEGVDSITDASMEDSSRNLSMDTYSDRDSSSGSELSELAIHTLLVETHARDLDREVYKDPDSEVNEKGTREKNDGNEVIEEGTNTPLDLDPNEVIEADDETLPYAEEDWQDPEQTEVPKNMDPDLPFTMQTRQGDGKRPRKKYNRYGDDYVVDKIDLKKIVEEVVGLESITVSQDIDIVDDHDQEWIEDRSEPEVEFDEEQSESNRNDLTNLRVLEWLNETTSDPGKTSVTIQDVDRESMKYIKTERDDPSWAAQEGRLLIPASNLDLIPGMRSTGTPMDIFVRGVGVGLTHTENLIIKKLRVARETGDLEAETGEEPKKPDIGRVVESYFNLPNEYSSNIVLTDSDFILTNRTCAIAITADMSFRTALAVDFKREYKNVEFLWKQRPGIGDVAALPPAVSQIPGKYLCFLVTRATEKQHVDPETLVLSLARLRDFLVEMDVKELSLPVYDPNRGRLHPRELCALVHVIFSDTNVQVYLHKKYYLSIG